MTAARGPVSSLVSADAGPASVTWATPPATGSKVLVWTGTFSTAAPPTSVTDNAGNTFTLDASKSFTSGSNILVATLWRCDNVRPGSGTYTVTVNWAGTSAPTSIVGAAYTGLAAGGPSGTGTGGATSTSASTSPAVPVPAAGGIAAGVVTTDAYGTSEPSTVTSAGWAMVAQQANGATSQVLAASDAVFTGSGSTSAAWTVSATSGTNPDWAAVMAVYPAALSPASNLADPLTGGSINSALWTASGTVAWSQYGVTLASTAGQTVYSSIASAAQWNLTGSAIYVELAAAGNQSLASWEATLAAYKDSSDGVYLNVSGGNLVAQQQVAGTFSGVGQVPYSAAAMGWLRIRESAGTVYWGYSADGKTWTDFASKADPVSLSSVTVELSAGTYNAETVATSGLFLNFNVTPSGSPVVSPQFQAARNGLPGDQRAGNLASQAGQFLTAHGVTPSWAGNRVFTPSAPGTTTATTGGTVAPFSWQQAGAGQVAVSDVDQPFTLPSGVTSVGRAEVAVLASGAGADLQVLLCPDNGSGAPVTGTPLASAVIPASHITSVSPGGSLAAGAPPLATAAAAAAWAGPQSRYTWTQPAGTVNGSPTYASAVTSGNWTLFVAGVDGVSFNAVSAVAAVQYLGGGLVSGAVQQPGLPQGAWELMTAVTTDAVIACGGLTANSLSDVTADVWSASWDPSTGTLGAWSAQQALPAPLMCAGAAAWQNTVYLCGGTIDLATPQSGVLIGQEQNGQITAWTQGPSLPSPTFKPLTAVIGNWLIVAGGNINSTGTTAAVWYAAIQPDGTLGAWQAGPSLPVSVMADWPGCCLAVTDSAMIIVNGQYLFNTPSGVYTRSLSIQSLTVGASGPASEWQMQAWSLPGGVMADSQCAAYPDGQGWELVSFQPGYYASAPLTLAPLVSVPLPASGLTAGATYHLVLRQLGGDTTVNYLSLGMLNPVAGGGAQYASRYGSSWTAFPGPAAVAVNVEDATPGGPPVHLTQDGGARITTLVTAPASGQLLGVLDTTAFPSVPLNSNPTFTSGIAPWGASGGTFTQSSAQVHGGYPFSGLLTPPGTATLSYAFSEPLPVTAGHWYTASGWFYSPPGATFSLSVNWSDSAGHYLATSSHPVSLAAASWTQVTNTFTAPPGAAKAQLVPTESGTPPATALLYCSNVTLAEAAPGEISAVTQLAYNAGYPSGTVQLA